MRFVFMIIVAARRPLLAASLAPDVVFVDGDDATTGRRLVVVGAAVFDACRR